MAFDEVSSPRLAKKFSALDFDSQEYVKNLLKECDIAKELMDHRHNVQLLSDETSLSMKKNVYRNYKQFIDTSKEISYLEAEMYQLSHLFTEQKSILTGQLETNMFGSEQLENDKAKAELTKKIKKKEEKLADRVEGSKDILKDVKMREVIQEGDLIEIDPETYVTSQKVYAFLLEDSLLITTYPSKLSANSEFRYRFQRLFDLSDVAVVNVRDGGGVKNAFKVLYSLETRMFGAEKKEIKLTWLDRIDQAKKNYRKKVETETKDIQIVTETKKEETFEKQPSFEESDDERPPDEEKEKQTQRSYPDLLTVGWLLELPEDLDMCIAQRDFEGAVALVERANSYLRGFPEVPTLKEYRYRLDQRIKQLCEALEESLDNSASMRHVPLRSIRRYVKLLVRLGRGKLARELFLKNRGYAIRHSFRQLKMEGAAATYISKLANVFFTSVMETGKEFKSIFVAASSSSAYVVWAHRQLQHFVSVFVRQVFARNSGLSAVAVCINIAMDHCRKLFTIGLDLTFDMQHMLLKHLMEALFDNRDQLIEGAKRRGNEESWKPMDYSKRPDELTTVLIELESLGIEETERLVTNKVLNLSHSTLLFSKGVLCFLEDGLKLYSAELHNVFVMCVAELFKTQVLLLQCTIKSDQFKSQTGLALSRSFPSNVFKESGSNLVTKLEGVIDFIIANVEFILSDVLAMVEKKIKVKLGYELDALQDIRGELPKLQKLAKSRKKF